MGGGVSAPSWCRRPTLSLRRGPPGELRAVLRRLLIVDAQGNTQRIQVVKHLGMGLDEKAVEAVRHYRFKPATLGKSGPVEMDVEVTFHIS